MNEEILREKIARLEREVFYVEMKDSLDQVDRDFIRETQQEIYRLKDILRGYE